MTLSRCNVHPITALVEAGVHLIAPTLQTTSFVANAKRCALEPSLAALSLRFQGYASWTGPCVECTELQPSVLFLVVALTWAAVLLLHAKTQRASDGAVVKVLLFFVSTARRILGAAYPWVSFGRDVERHFCCPS